MATPWYVPVRGRFTFRPTEPMKVRGGVIRRPVVPGAPIGERPLQKGCCYYCGSANYHVSGCPWLGVET